MQFESWIPTRVECPCGEIFVVRAEARLGYSAMREFSCTRCGLGHLVTGPILNVSRWVDDHWERLDQKEAP